MSKPTPLPQTPVACEMCYRLDAVPADAERYTFANDTYLGDHDPGLIEAGTTLAVCADCQHHIEVRAERQHRGL